MASCDIMGLLFPVRDCIGRISCLAAGLLCSVTACSSALDRWCVLHGSSGLGEHGGSCPAPVVSLLMRSRLAYCCMYICLISHCYRLSFTSRQWSLGGVILFILQKGFMVKDRRSVLSVSTDRWSMYLSGSIGKFALSSLCY